MGGELTLPAGRFFDDLARKLAERERRAIDDRDLAEAAVLVPLLGGAGGETEVVLTRRLDTLAAHPGQVAFPGGARDADDATPLATALREAEEELAIPRESVTVLGALDDVHVITGYRVTPFVGRIPREVELRPNAAEVARVFTVSLAALVDPERTTFRMKKMIREGREHEVPFFEHGGELIWGATGRMLVSLLELAFPTFTFPPAEERGA